jgi:hypothetical protein
MPKLEMLEAELRFLESEASSSILCTYFFCVSKGSKHYLPTLRASMRVELKKSFFHTIQ